MSECSNIKFDLGNEFLVPILLYFDVSHEQKKRSSTAAGNHEQKKRSSTAAGNHKQKKRSSTAAENHEQKKRSSTAARKP